jgi:hypothetical protein
MVSITQSILVARPAAQVFGFACDYANDPAWRTGVQQMTVEPAGPPAQGAHTREVLRFMGKTYVSVAEIVRYEPDREAAFRVVQGPTPARGYRRVEPSGEAASRLTYHLEVEPRGLDAWFAPLLGMLLRRQLGKDMLRLQALLEARQPG